MSEEQTAIDSPPSTVEGSVETVTTIDSPSTTASTIAATAEEQSSVGEKANSIAIFEGSSFFGFKCCLRER